jgi:hypothetical protein
MIEAYNAKTNLTVFCANGLCSLSLGRGFNGGEGSWVLGKAPHPNPLPIGEGKERNGKERVVC